MGLARFVRKHPSVWEWGQGTSIIWHPAEVENHYEHPYQSFCYFRKSFALDQDEAVTGKLSIFADSRYILYVNGIYAGRGPCRSDPRWQYVDELDVTGLLNAGTNTIAVMVLYYGYGTGQSIDRIPALAAELKVTLPEQENVIIGTDSSWVCRLSDAYDSRSPRINGCQGPIEVYDARQEPEGWQLPGFDEEGWQKAKTRGIGLSPFWNFGRRPIPLMEEKELDALRLVSRGSVRQLAEPSGRLHLDIIEETKNMKINLLSSTPYNISSKQASHGEFEVLTYDFGRIEPGYLQLDVTGTDGTIVDIVYAEELWKGKALLNVNNNRSIDRFILKEGWQRLEVRFGWKACRFVQLRIRHADSRSIMLHRVGMRTRKYPIDQPAVFQCSDERLQKIWDISEHTIRICMQDAFVDSPSREQQQWMGDGRWQGLYQTYYSGDGRLHRKLLEQVGQSQDWQGMTAQRYPDGHHNYPPIPSFCLHWVSSFNEYMDAYGDDGLLIEWWPNIVQALRWFSGFENREGLLENVPYWAYIDAGEAPLGRWPDVERGGIVTSLNLLYLEAMQNAAKYAKLVDDREAEAYYRKAAGSLANSIRQYLWLPDSGAYTECLVNGEASRFYSESANALALLVLHEAGDERSETIYRSVFAPEADGISIKASPFFMTVVYRALMKLMREDRMLELVRERYGRMIDAGAASVWEWWDLFYGNEHKEDISFSSACHAWGSMPVYMFLHSILGIQPSEANKRVVIIQPKLPKDLMWAAGSIPTTFGPLAVRVERLLTALDTGCLEITVPQGVKAICGDVVYGQGKHVIDNWIFH
ncbi:family 78 glycoside hydrolase catalytic domain [Paenibacillus sp. BK720]|uniref:family 78 glycoside hydrolase catalytic domain n=1 Tax=Paenibacillus sp. BK720 TaxID=2587092 RepID=UPI00141F7BE0|nr:hypothetical protein [Paenibacillus sp. BK720]